MLQQLGEVPSTDRLLPEQHFEFRGGASSARPSKRNRAADGS
jgi:hypothetical protein